MFTPNALYWPTSKIWNYFRIKKTILTSVMGEHPCLSHKGKIEEWKEKFPLSEEQREERGRSNF